MLEVAIHTIIASRFGEREVVPHHVVGLDYDVDNRRRGSPLLHRVKLRVENERLRVGRGTQIFVEWVNNVFGTVVDDADVGRLVREGARQHHIVVNLADLASDLDLHDSLDL